MRSIDVLFGQRESEFLLLRLGNIEPPTVPHVREVSIAASASFRAFRAEIDTVAYLVDLQRFADDLEELHRSLSGVVTLRMNEPSLALTLGVDSKGHVQVKGHLSEPGIENGSVLRFLLRRDQTELPPVIASLREFIAVHT